QKVHEEALRILHQKIAEGASATATTAPTQSPENLVNPGLNVRPSAERTREAEEEARRARTEREKRLTEEAKANDAVRLEKQEEKRQKWESDVAQREALR